MDDVTELIRAISTLLWPLVALFALARLLPELRKRFRSSDVNVKFGGVELSLQDASDSLRRQVDDLQAAVQGLLEGTTGDAPQPRATTRGGGPAPRAASPAPGPRSILWVDDDPANNAYEVAKLREHGVQVHQAATIGEALDLLAARHPDVVITDVARRSDGTDDRYAGRDLIRELQRRGVEVPVVVYTSAEGVATHGDALLAEGATAATSSPLELLRTLDQLRG